MLMKITNGSSIGRENYLAMQISVLQTVSHPKTYPFFEIRDTIVHSKCAVDGRIFINLINTFLKRTFLGLSLAVQLASF